MTMLYLCIRRYATLVCARARVLTVEPKLLNFLLKK